MRQILKSFKYTVTTTHIALFAIACGGGTAADTETVSDESQDSQGEAQQDEAEPEESDSDESGPGSNAEEESSSELVGATASESSSPLGELNFSWDLTSLGVGIKPAFILDSADNTHIAYFAFDGDTTSEIRHAWLDGGNWQFEVVDRLDDVRRGRVGARKITALALDGEDNLHIAYRDRNCVVYGQRGDDSWST